MTTEEQLRDLQQKFVKVLAWSLYVNQALYGDIDRSILNKVVRELEEEVERSR